MHAYQVKSFSIFACYLKGENFPFLYRLLKNVQYILIIIHFMSYILYVILTEGQKSNYDTYYL
jgi:hypothetical protein